MSNPLLGTPQVQSHKEFELELLKQEYFFLQTTIEEYNKQIWIIKALGITGTGAVIALMVQLKSGAIAFIGCAIPLFFWLLESQWKHFQRGFYPRVFEIENIFTNNYNFHSPLIYTGWTKAFKQNSIPKRRGYLWDGLLNSSVYLSYALQIVFLLILGVIAAPWLK